MSKQDECRRFAAACLDLATRATDLTNKAGLLAMAEAWLKSTDLPRMAVHLPTSNALHTLTQRVSLLGELYHGAGEASFDEEHRGKSRGGKS